MTKLEDMSRNELLAICKDFQKDALRVANHPPMASCPFCYREGYVSHLKTQVRSDLVEQWRADVTQEELEAWAENHYPNPPGVPAANAA